MRKYLSIILKIRSICFVLAIAYTIQLFMLRSLVFNASVLNIITLNFDLQHLLFKLRTEYSSIERVFGNCIALVEGNYSFSWFAAFFVVYLGIIAFIYYIKNKQKKVLFYILLIFVGIYAYFLNDLVFVAAIIIVNCILIFFDFIVYDNNTIFTNEKQSVYLGILLFFTIGISELICYPLYVKYVNTSSGKSLKRDKFRTYFRSVYYYLILVMSLILFAPQPEGNFQNMDRIAHGDVYGLKISQKYSTLFFRGECRDSNDNCIYSMDLSGNSKKNLLYPKDKNDVSLSEFIDIDENKNELFIINRTDHVLVSMDPEKLRMKSRLFHKKLDNGDLIITHNAKNLFLLCEDDIEVIKIARYENETVTENMISELGYSSRFLYNPDNNVLYISNWYNPEDPGGFFLWEVDAGTLSEKRKLLFPGPILGFYLYNEKLYCAVVSGRSIYVLNVNSFTIDDTIDVPLATRAVAIDEERQLLFAGNTISNIVVVIDLVSKKRLWAFKAGRCSLREIVLDKKRCTMYVSTKTEGLFVASYKNLIL
ncbi:MAG: hypothetical protein GY754_19605 [bacterium]|nr:hypothetical protein [bacterium]